MDLSCIRIPTPRLPIDVLLCIIEFVDQSKDLLSIALTARSLCAVIIPRHIDSRRISCPASSEHVWKYLLDTPNACSRVRYLNTKLGVQTRVPRMCGTDPDSTTSPTRDRGYTLFSQALSSMVNLKVLRHSTDDKAAELMLEAIGRAGYGLEELEVQVWQAISKRRARARVAKDPSQHVKEIVKSQMEVSSFVDLPSLRKLTIAGNIPYDRLQALNAPNLTHMNVMHGHPPAFLFGYWPNLQHLVTNWGYAKSDSDAHNLKVFLHRHPKLITLSSDGILSPGYPVEGDDFLVNLRSLDMTVCIPGHVVIPVAPYIAARLTHLHMTASLFSYLRKHGTILSDLETCLYLNADPRASVQDLVELIPNIRKLYVRFGSIPNGSRWRQMTDDEIVEQIPSFAKFKYLRILLGPFDNATGISINDHPLCELLYNFPSLLYTRARLRKDGPFACLRLERDRIARVMRYQIEETRPEECVQQSWGGFFIGT